MLKKLLSLVLLISATSFAGINADSTSHDPEFRTLENNAFTVGEKLTFDVKYGFVTAGVATMEIPEMRRISGREAYHVTFEVNSVPSFDWIYKVRDRYET